MTLRLTFQVCTSQKIPGCVKNRCWPADLAELVITPALHFPGAALSFIEAAEGQ